MPDMIRGRSAAAANDINKSILRPIFDKMRRLLRQFVILAHCIWQAGVGIGAHVATGYLRQLLYVWPHLLRAQQLLARAERYR